jgi:hypothetical protein
MKNTALARAALLSAVLPLGAAGSAYKERYLLPVSVDGGQLIDAQVYGRISPGDRWVLRIDASSFQLQDEEVIEELLNRVLKDHEARLDSIRFETRSSPSFQQEVIARLKESNLSDSLVVRQQSRAVTAELASIIRQSALVKMICSKVSAIHARCPSAAVAMNPVAFKTEHLGQTWGQVKSQQDVGIQPESLAFFIELQPE